MIKHEEMEQARADVHRLKQRYETACQLWRAQRSANKQDEMHRVGREYENAQATLRQLEEELSLTTAKQRDQELARAAAHQSEQERKGRRVLNPDAQVRRTPNRGLER